MVRDISSDDLAQLIRSFADSGTQERDPQAVARAVVMKSARQRKWFSFGATAACLILLAVLGGISFKPADEVGLKPPSAQVRGLAYAVVVARGVDLGEVSLTPFATGKQNAGYVTEDATTYRVGMIDPEHVLAMKLVPGQRDDAGALGNFLMLVRGDGLSLLCDYFKAGDPLAPTVCQ